MTEPPLHRVRVWDLPTRMFHWCLAACVTALVVTGQLGGAWMPWHARLGYSVGALVVFRVVWGVVGGRWSRFRAFVVSPAQTWAYLRANDPAPAVGHSPAGAASVVAMLAVLAVQVATGLFADDTADFAGPLNPLVSNASARLLTLYHKDVGQWLVIGLVVLHVGAIAYYKRRKGLGLTAPMLHGDKLLDAPALASRDDIRSRVGALAVFAAIALATVMLVRLAD